MHHLIPFAVIGVLLIVILFWPALSGRSSVWRVDFKKTFYSNGEAFDFYFICSRTRDRVSELELIRYLTQKDLVFAGEEDIFVLDAYKKELPHATYVSASSDTTYVLTREQGVVTQKGLPFGDGHIYVAVPAARSKKPRIIPALAR